MKPSLIHSVTIFLTLLALTFSAAGVTPAYAATFTVTTTSNNGAGSLRQIIVDAPSGSTITFDASLSGTTIYLAAPLDIVKKVTIDGSMLASKITISGDSDGNGSGNVGVFTNSAGSLADSVKLDSLIITLGRAYDPITYGGGIYNTGNLRVYNCTLDNNYAYGVGGAIYNGGFLTVTNSTFSNNFAQAGGGGIYNDGTLTVTSSTFSGNDTWYDGGGSATHGGGIYNSGVLSVTNSTLSGNSATNSGGGIYNSDTLTVTNSTLSMNHANSAGGGIYIKNGATARVSNSTIKSNTSDFSAGGIYNASYLVLINSTLRGNLANLDGGAMFNNGTGSANIYNSTIVFNAADWDADINGGQAGGIYNSNSSVVNLFNSLVAGNSVSGAPVYDDCRGNFNSHGWNLIGAESVSPSGASCTIYGSWMNLNDLNLLGPLQDNGGPTQTTALLPGNNAIDHGSSVLGCVDDANTPLVTDQRGFARVAGTWCDIGAYEFVDTPAPIVNSITRVNPATTNLVSLGFVVTFSEPVTGVDTGDFALTTTGVSGAVVSGVSGSGSTYTVTVNTGTGNGTIRLDVLNNSTIKDINLKPLGAGFTNGEIYTVIKSATFTDTPLAYWASSYIERLYNAGITGGCSITPLNYCPDNTVTRAQMAIFLLKGMHGVSYTPPALGGSTGFTDVATNYWAAAWIKQLAAEGITSGCGSGNYCPDATVTRAQMAVFLLKAKHGSSYAPPVATGVFTDVPVGYWADKWIERLAVEGITGGCGVGVYCPDNEVTRAQMAVFLVKAFGLP